MRILGRFFLVGGFLFILMLGGCAPDHGEKEKKLLSFVRDLKFEVPPVVMEMQGEFFKGEWYRVALYFGYAGDGNWKNCQEEADRLNKIERSKRFRCNATF